MGMARLIDADALLDYFRNEHHESEVIEAVKDAPTIDAVPLVRCKDCQFSEYYKCSETRHCRTQNGMYRAVEDDDFCSWGERKDNDG